VSDKELNHDKAYLSIEKDDEREGNLHISIQSHARYGETEQDDVIDMTISMEKRNDGHLTDWVTMEFTAQEARLIANSLLLMVDNAERLKAKNARNAAKEALRQELVMARDMRTAIEQLEKSKG
jgi:hypothetical protein